MAFSGPTQDCIVPVTAFELPQGEAFERGKYLEVVTDPVAIHREKTELEHPLKLTLRLRDHDPALLEEIAAHPERLWIFCKEKDPKTSRGVALDINPEALEVVDFERGKGVAFPIARFGSYLAAFERDRN